MIDFIPLNSYQFVYEVLVGSTVIILAAYSFASNDFSNTPPSLNILVTVFFVTVLLLLGLRPISFMFGDMGNYNIVFQRIASGSSPPENDVLFHSLMKFSADFLNANWFFLICFAIYLVPYYFALKRWFGRNWIWPFVMMVCLFSFYAYGVNGIRNGMAASVFLLGLSHKKTTRWVLLLSAVLIHSSMALPLAAVLIYRFFKNINYYVLAWFACLILTIAIPSIGNIIANTGLLEDKFVQYASIDINNQGMGVSGFRPDFLLFSILPIAIGLYYIYKLKFYDPVYNEILAVYITANAFWLLVIDIPFSNRFAYLSWFLYGLVIAYPLVKSNILLNASRYYALLLVSLFTFSVTFF